MKSRILMGMLFMFFVDFLFAGEIFDFDSGKSNLDLSNYLDVKTPSIAKEEPVCQKQLYKINENSEIIEVKHSKSYLDVFFPQRKSDVGNKMKIEDKGNYIQCCKGNEVDENVIEQCVK